MVVLAEESPAATATPLPEGVTVESRIVLYDGICNLCNGWVKFLLKRDRPGRLRLAAVQSQTGGAILSHFGLPTDHFDTMVFVEQSRAYVKSDAFLQIVGYLPWPWPWLRIGFVIPRPVRNWLYDRVALNRYRLFGKSDACMVPTPQIASRFLP